MKRRLLHFGIFLLVAAPLAVPGYCCMLFGASEPTPQADKACSRCHDEPAPDKHSDEKPPCCDCHPYVMDRPVTLSLESMAAPVLWAHGAHASVVLSEPSASFDSPDPGQLTRSPSDLLSLHCALRV